MNACLVLILLIFSRCVMTADKAEKVRIKTLKKIGVFPESTAEEITKIREDIDDDTPTFNNVELFYDILNADNSDSSRTILRKYGRLKLQLRWDREKSDEVNSRNLALAKLYKMMAYYILQFHGDPAANQIEEDRERLADCEKNCHVMLGFCMSTDFLCHCFFEDEVTGEWCSEDLNDGTDLAAFHKVPRNIAIDPDVDYWAVLGMKAGSVEYDLNTFDRAYAEMGEDHVKSKVKLRELFVALQILSYPGRYPVVDASICREYCSEDNGVCKKRKCVCIEPQYWAGQWCDVETDLLLNKLRTCKQKCHRRFGYCIPKSGVCSCLKFKFYKGKWCDEWQDIDCISHHDCQHRGKCLPNDKGRKQCVCPASYGGKLCEEPMSCFGENNEDLCGANGKCEHIKIKRKVKISKCRCRNRYTGIYCESNVLLSSQNKKWCEKLYQKKSTSKGKKTGVWKVSGDEAYCDCFPGWQDPNCKTKCDSHFYGKRCSQTCLGRHYCNNFHVCDHVTGACPKKKNMTRCFSGWRTKKCNRGTRRRVLSYMKLKRRNRAAIANLREKDILAEEKNFRRYVIQWLVKKDLDRAARQKRQEPAVNSTELSDEELEKAGLAAGFRVENVRVAAAPDAVDVNVDVDYPADESSAQEFQTLVRNTLLENADSYKSSLGEDFQIDVASISVSKPTVVEISYEEQSPPSERTVTNIIIIAGVVVFALLSSCFVLARSCRTMRKLKAEQAAANSRGSLARYSQASAVGDPPGGKTSYQL